MSYIYLIIPTFFNSLLLLTKSSSSLFSIFSSIKSLIISNLDYAYYFFIISSFFSFNNFKNPTS